MQGQMRKLGQPSDVVVVGRSCRLPGAASVEDLWANLLAGRCSIGRVPDDRWALAKHGHPRQREAGKSYVWSAGTIDDVWSFDPSVFGMSPREAEQTDPQQRILLELTWEALEDAGIRRSDIAGTNVGVFVGASSTEYQNIRNADIASVDGYTATGGALSIVSNRISHAFDLHGPSFTVDTACSSSLVALHQALSALRSGVIDTAIVGGVNVLLSPFGFILFSQASMLSPGGLCRTFDAKADGYVRAEGGVVLVLRSAAKAAADDNRVHSRIVASGVNSDGRTNGIALPSPYAQEQLLRDVYRRANIAPDDVAFIEAHGTGTRVGDPIEASVIGKVIGQGRSEKLLVGSIKSNIGHLEPGSGLAGVLKAMLALEHDRLPPSVNFDEPNPDIAFDELNLAVCTEPTAIPRNGAVRYAGVNSFGFGGTNAHVVLADPLPAKTKNGKAVRYQSDLFPLSAATDASLRDLARGYADTLATTGIDATSEAAAAAAHQRELLPERTVIQWDSPRDLVRKLQRFADKEADIPGITRGAVTEAKAPVAFVFSGNGGQWPGMGRGAYATSRRFRETFDEIDAIFDSDFGWSVTEALLAEDLEQRLRLTHIAQPLIFATQISVARALRAEGLEPAFTLGHSVGEIAAAAVSGALTLRESIAVIQARSTRQEIARDAGRMAVVAAQREQVEALCAEIGGLTLAAENAPRAFTVSGLTESVEELIRVTRQRRIAARQLDLDYPFHCWLIDDVRAPLIADLAPIEGRAPSIPMISTVTGDVVDGPLGPDYWWHNVRDPVLFATAAERAARLGARIFVEIGPRSILLSNLNEVLETTGLPCTTLGVLERHEKPEDSDPIRPAVLSAFTRGANIELDRLFGPKPSRTVTLPRYAWARREFRPVETTESQASILNTRWHALLGARGSVDTTEWSGLLDSTILPELADHRVGAQAILPGAAFVEIALEAAREWFGSDDAALLELDISQPLPIEADRSRELKTRFSPATSTLEILSRPRLARGGWTSHAAAHLTAGEPEAVEAGRPEIVETIGAEAIYQAAESVGLHYGPAFRLLRSVGRTVDDRLLVDLEPAETTDPRYGIDPARLDACFHGLFSLFARLGAAGRGMAYIPVRFGAIRLYRRGVPLAGALIEITKAGEGSILADFTLLDGEGLPIGRIADARFQAARIQRGSSLGEKALAAEWVPIDAGAIGRPGLAVTVEAILAAAATADEADDRRTDDQMLLDAWAVAAGLAILRRIAGSDHLGRDRLVALDEATASWATAILHALAGHGLAEEAEDGWRLAAKEGLPAADMVLRTLASDHPSRSAELLLASRLTAWTPDGTASGEAAPPAIAFVDGFELGGIAVRAAGDAIDRLLDATGLLSAATPGLRILQVGFSPLAFGLSLKAREAGARLTILDLDARRIERARLSLDGGHVAFADALDALPAGGFDLIVSAAGLHRPERAGALLPALRQALAPGGLLIAVEPEPSLFRDLVLGLGTDWFGTGAVSPLRNAAEWSDALSLAGFRDPSATALATEAEEATLLVAAAGEARDEPVAEPSRILIRPLVEQRAGRLSQRLAEALDGHDVEIGPGGRSSADEVPLPAGTITVACFDPEAARDNVRTLNDAILALLKTAELCPRNKGELWVVASAGEAAGQAADPVASGLLAFARTLANEMPAITIRRIEVSRACAPEIAAATLAALLLTPQTESDIEIGPDGTRCLRFIPLAMREPKGARTTTSLKLERGSAGGLSGLAWAPAEASAPKAGEVEIEVEATGLNFRDVMWAMSLLPDDILEDGFAGPTLGLECAGRIRRVGPGATRFQPGDRVLAFAPSAFSSSVCVPEGVVMPVPADWTTEAGAGVPVAFLTAYYGLVTLGRLKAGDWVLIHGAAGGVGLAAIQIAQWRGATVVATAGSREKRDLLRALGVEHVLNSRSTAFADDIRRIRRQGVEVVLNSLSGEAMERSIATLKPFGRFIELGKRDYVANTRIGLRPFKRNLSYFGVDVDQLLSDRDQASGIFAEIMALFEAGEFRPLPYRVFGEGETTEAFRLMQQSGHVGKILVRPPQRPMPVVENRPFAFDPDRTHLITGGFGGFGLEAARWLVDRGVRHLALLGRSGAASEDAAALVAELEARGVSLRAIRCDIGNERSVRRALDEIAAEMPPLAGILHAAMVLEDGLAANLTAEQLDRVLPPKVAGADHLDRLTSGMALDYLVFFSSITTFIGNPGQGAYVAANAYLEGLARRRREKGLPGLALAWGAISDVGVLARKKGLAEALAKRVGVIGMPAREALDLMAQALSADPATSPAVMAVGSLDWNAARRLPALASPTFASLMREGGTAETGERKSIDLRALLASEPEEAVRKRVAETIVEEIAAVLRVPRQDIAMTKRLGELGLDSLMAFELASALQDRLGLDDPPTGSVAAMTTLGLADQIIAIVSAGQADDAARAVQSVNDRHAGLAYDQDGAATVAEVLATRSKDVKGLTH
ncbi:acyl transferase domain-containing protein [Enterovirga rhinocerotis]|uniref:Acyl transferase domain-containing protein n=2 Tax=Enterovirga rhinocerotis TaxID=1339210 RepID=A0A4R7C6M8_9HYPH|nr:acyl transferase domain-containing protein [Enterovirga rhinocerotis]